MELIILGCDGSYPGPDGACSGYLVDGGAAGKLLMDCGSGVLPRLMAHMDPAELYGIVITHWHNDHASDMLTLRYYLQIHQKKLKVWAPLDEHPLRALCECEQFELIDLAQGLEMGDIHISTMLVNHPLPAYALRLQQAHKAMVYSSDATLTPGLDQLCQGADLLLCDATFTTQQWHDELPHMSAAQAAELAKDAQVKRLLLTHCQPGSDSALLLSQAQAVFAESRWAQALQRYPL